MEGIINLHTYIMFYLVAIVVFVFVGMGLTIYEFYWNTPHRDRGERMSASKVVHSTWLELVWTIAPLGILIAIAGPSFLLLYSMEEKWDVDITIKAIGHQWYWEYEYAVVGKDFGFDSYMTVEADLEEGGLRLLETDTTALLPYWRKVRLLTSSADVIHSWALPAAGVKMDAVPGRLNQVNLYFNRAGFFYGQCSELCGVNHGFMPIAVKVLDLNEFRVWSQVDSE